MPWNFSKWDWGEILMILAPVAFAALFGVLLALAIGALTIHLLFEALF